MLEMQTRTPAHFQIGGCWLCNGCKLYLRFPQVPDILFFTREVYSGNCSEPGLAKDETQLLS
jgi:hypothetical protein